MAHMALLSATLAVAHGLENAGRPKNSRDSAQTAAPLLKDALGRNGLPTGSLRALNSGIYLKE